MTVEPEHPRRPRRVGAVPAPGPGRQQPGAAVLAQPSADRRPVEGPPLSRTRPERWASYHSLDSATSEAASEGKRTVMSRGRS